MVWLRHAAILGKNDNSAKDTVNNSVFQRYCSKISIAEVLVFLIKQDARVCNPVPPVRPDISNTVNSIAHSPLPILSGRQSKLVEKCPVTLSGRFY